MAIFFLGIQHQYGRYGLEIDVTRAAELYERAAELGVIDAHYNLGVLYDEETDVEKDTAKAIMHYEAAAMCGHVASRHNLGCKECDVGNYDLALKNWMISATLGYENSLNNVKSFFMNGLATKADYAAALRRYQNAVGEMSRVLTEMRPKQSWRASKVQNRWAGSSPRRAAEAAAQRGGIRCYGHGQYSATDGAHRTPEQATSPYGGACRLPPCPTTPGQRSVDSGLVPIPRRLQPRLPGVARAGSRRLGSGGGRRPSTSSPAPPVPPPPTSRLASFGAVLRSRRGGCDGNSAATRRREYCRNLLIVEGGGGGAGAGRRPGRGGRRWAG